MCIWGSFILWVKNYHITYILVHILMRKIHIVICFHNKCLCSTLVVSLIAKHMPFLKEMLMKDSVNNVCCQSFLKVLLSTRVHLREIISSKLISFANFLPSLLESAHLAQNTQHSLEVIYCKYTSFCAVSST